MASSTTEVTVLVRVVATSIATFVVAFTMACGQPTHGAGSKPDGSRLVSGSVDATESASLGQYATGVQIAAVAIGVKSNPGRVDLFGSSVFDASHPESATFATAVDGKRSFVLILQVPAGAANGAGQYLGTLHFGDGRGGDTTLLPPGTDDIELGTVTLASANTLTVDDANNPLAQVDTDNDGTPDLVDTDDDGDGADDSNDPDVGGDGVPDEAQLLDVADHDGDGIPDALERS